MICKRMQSICERWARGRWGEPDPGAPLAAGRLAPRGPRPCAAGVARPLPAEHAGGPSPGRACGGRGGRRRGARLPSGSRHRGSKSSEAVGLRLLRGGCARCAQLARPPGARPARGGGAQRGVRPALGCPAPRALRTLAKRWGSSARSHSTAPRSCTHTGSHAWPGALEVPES